MYKRTFGALAFLFYFVDTTQSDDPKLYPKHYVKIGHIDRSIRKI